MLITGLGDGFYKSPNASIRAKWLDRTVDARAGIVRINVLWRTVASAKPSHPRNPGDPAYHFESVDAAVSDARDRGLKVLLTAYGAPAWAEGKHRPDRSPAGTWKPREAAFGDFGHALAQRYSGHFSGLPRVRYYEAWNEPNLSVYLTPQWHNKKPKSPKIYRRLLNAFYSGVKSVSRGDMVISGGTAPFGNAPGGERMRPVRFVRSLLCLRNRERLRRKQCGTKPHMDALAHHPINRIRGPHHHALNPDDVAVPDLGRIKRVLRAAARHHTVRPRGKIPLWVTEFWWETNPPDRRLGIPVHTEARWIEEALYLFWKAGARTAINLQIRDSTLTGVSSYQTGIYFHNGHRKPSFKSFRFPFVAHRHSKRSVQAWGIPPASGKLVIQRRKHGDWRAKKRLSVRRGRPFKVKLRLRGGATLRARVKGTTSIRWRQRG